MLGVLILLLTLVNDVQIRQDVPASAALRVAADVQQLDRTVPGVLENSDWIIRGDTQRAFTGVLCGAVQPGGRVDGIVRIKPTVVIYVSSPCLPLLEVTVVHEFAHLLDWLDNSRFDGSPLTLSFDHPEYFADFWTLLWSYDHNRSVFWKSIQLLPHRCRTALLGLCDDGHPRLGRDQQRQDHLAERAFPVHPQRGADRHDRKSLELALQQPHVVALEARPADVSGRNAISQRDLQGVHRPTGLRPAFSDKLRARGCDLRPELFLEDAL